MLVPAVSSMHALPECETNASEIYLRKNLPSKKAFNKFSNPGWVGGEGGFITWNQNVMLT